MNFNKIKVHCTDNDKLIEADVVSQSDGWITVLLQPGDIKLTLRRTKPNLYVGQMHGYEFTWNNKI